MCNDTPYYYVKNVQGDVYKIVDASGSVVASYTYDAWGKVLTATGTMADINPIRYRGYYYDSESGLYYLNSRYYDSETGRFVNADSVVSGVGGDILGYNMFAYCMNNPVNMSDYSGNWATQALSWLFVSKAAAAEAAAIATGGIVLLSIAVVCLAIWSVVEIYNFHQAKKDEAVARAVALMDYASTAATPPPPNKGGKGTQVTSKTLYNKRGKEGFRIDVENPGNRLGQIHLEKAGKKYIYDVAGKAFRIKTSSGALAPQAIQQLLQEPEVIKAIAKGLTILGY